MSLRRREDSGIDFYTSYSYGDILPEYIGHVNATQFDLRKGHAILFILLSNPTQDEIREIKYGAFEARMTCLPDILWMTFKFGDLPYIDAPFSPHLVKDLELPKGLNKACEFLQIVVVDTMNGRVMALRAIKFNETFSAALRVGCLCLLPQEFDRKAYDILLLTTLSKYSPESIAKRATVVFNAQAINECRCRSGVVPDSNKPEF